MAVLATRFVVDVIAIDGLEGSNGNGKGEDGV